MNFVHDDAEFGDLLRIVADRQHLAIGLVEKDYWVTHTLWALHEQGLEIWLKGGTSLSKGYGIIERFSEDLDLKIEPGRVAALPEVTNWTSEGKKAIARRQAYFQSLARVIEVPGARAVLGSDCDEGFRSANIRIEYPSKHLADLTKILRPFVLLEVGSARVTPFVVREMTSFVHDYLEREEQLPGFLDNRPTCVRCVHPLVTLVEKLDALARRLPRENVETSTFVRHFEDAACIISARATLSPLDGYDGVRALAEEMLARKQIAALPMTTHDAFVPNDAPRWRAVRSAHAAIAPMFWGVRTSIERACSVIREWIASDLG